MEITNNSRYYSIPLVCGRRIAQIVFFDTDGTVPAAVTGNSNGTELTSYERTGKYQCGTTDINQLIQSWKPSDMLPKMWADREIIQGPAIDILIENPKLNINYTPIKFKNSIQNNNNTIAQL